MLGRLEMDVDECTEAYTSMFQTIFEKKGLPVNMWGNIKGRFGSTVLDECIRTILKGRGLSDAEPLSDGKARCKVYVSLYKSVISNQGVGLSAQKHSRLQQLSFCGPTTQAMLLITFPLQSAKQ